MTFTVIDSTNSINDPNHEILGALHLGAGDSALITSSGYVIAQEGGTTAVYLDGYTNGSVLTVAGTLYSAEEAIYALGQNNKIHISGLVYGDVSSTGMQNTIDISATGYVSGNVTIGGQYSSLANYGTIDGPNGFGIQMVNAEVLNTGIIKGGIFNDGSASGSIQNSGTILGDLYSQTADTVTGILYITNSGQWDGSLGIGGGGSQVTNSGYVGAINFAGGDNRVTNTGTIDGDVSFGDGGDSFDTRHGTFFGTVFGGGGDDVLLGGAGDETFDGGAGADTINGRGGENTVNYATSPQGVYVDLAHNIAKYGTAAGDQLSHIQDIIGSTAKDTLLGNGSGNAFNGVLGNDTITGYGGDDTITMLGKSSAHLNGGSGNDTFMLSTAAASTYGNAFTAGMHIDGGADFDTVVLTGAANVVFTATTMVGVERIQMEDGFNFKLTTNDTTVAAGQTLQVDASALGSTFRLTFDGSAETNGTFVIDGGAGADVLKGGAGNDVITGGLGQDTLTGGLGHDTFAYLDAFDSTGAKFDKIKDFDANSDHIAVTNDITGIDAAVTGVSISQATFDEDIHGAATVHANHAMLVTANAGDYSGHTFLVVDINGHAGYHSGVDIVIDVTGMTGTLTTGDFI